MQEELEACMEEKPINTDVRVCYDRSSTEKLKIKNNRQYYLNQELLSFSIFNFILLHKRRVKKKIKSIMENSILGGRGVSEGHFPYPIFLFFFAPNGLKIIFRHWSFFMYRGGAPLGAPQAPPRLHRYILRWQNHVKAKIARVVDKILRVAAIIARAAAKSGIWEAKICLSESSFIIFKKIF